MVHAIDTVLLLTACLLPILLVWRLNRLGLWLGAAVAWGTLILAGWVLKELDPQRDGRVSDGVWLVFGWLPSLLYCILLSVLKDLGLYLSRRLAKRP